MSTFAPAIVLGDPIETVTISRHANGYSMHAMGITFVGTFSLDELLKHARWVLERPINVVALPVRESNVVQLRGVS